MNTLHGKYILFTDGSCAVFGAGDDFRRKVWAVGKTPLRAGWWHKGEKDKEIRVYGGSSMLKLDSSREDVGVIKKALKVTTLTR